MFGWNDDPVTIAPTTNVSPTPPPHEHTATRPTPPYYGGHVHLGGSQAPRASPTQGPGLSPSMRPPPPSRRPPPPAPSMYKTTQTPYPYHYAAQPYYSPSHYYNPYYPPPAYPGQHLYRAYPTLDSNSTTSSDPPPNPDPLKARSGEDDLDSASG